MRNQQEIVVTAYSQIIERSISDLDFVQSLKGTVKDLVKGAYVRGIMYTHSKNVFVC
jgi:hypothetical protein